MQTLPLSIGVRFCWIAFVWIYLVFVCPGTSRGEDALQKMVVSLDDPSPEVSKAKENFLSRLTGITPSSAPAVTITKGGCYILCGHLFGDGKSYVLATLDGEQPAEGEDPSIGVGFAVWAGDKWEVRGLWQIEPVWAADDPKKKEEDYFPIRPARAPFWLQELSGDNVPEIVIAGEVWRYFQYHYVLKLTREGKLKLVVDAMGEPAQISGLLRLYFKSVRRAIFSRYEFFRWTGDTLVPVAEFHSESPYNDPESPFVLITRYDATGKNSERWKIESGESDSESVSQYLLNRDLSNSEDDSTPRSEREEKWSPATKVSFVWPPGSNDQPGNNSLNIERRYFWEALSGLNWDVLPQEDDEPRVSRLPKNIQVRVNGDAGLVRCLSTDFQERIAPKSVRSERRGQ